ncbi:MAG: hypothetical protein UR81_C0001G0011 [Candidatus Levybacteria bacterium GW2011_GWB1_35_5]|nr:MAG: hypothetical protein UR81_C0001G0011 [Candidatus Levybacteria bacterium GW2011_GWB1_35_5]
MSELKKFVFVGFDVDLAKGEALFHYLIQLDKKTQDFTDKILFPPLTAQIPEDLLKSLLNNLLLVLGMSYWKLYCPPIIEIKPFSLTKKQAEFWNIVYTKGLGEFYYKNKIDFRGLMNFPFDGEKEISPINFPRESRSLVGIGGGKDSIVSGELLKKYDKNFDAFVVNEHMIRSDVIKILDANSIIFMHELDPNLLVLNKREDVYNGHVPISAYYAFLGLLAAVLYDYRFLIVSNEESANYGNVEYLGEVINHQWSKSLEFENLFRDYISSFISADLVYFSLLRPLKEIKITEVFAKYPEYFNFFSSCNRNFRINNEEKNKWCGQCPKCLFVFTILSTFISKEKLISIFGKNLFEDNNLLPLFKELLGISKIKPFECVGTPEEMQYALYLASEKGEFKQSLLIKFFEKEILSQINPMQLSKVMEIGSKENIPSEFENIFNEI